VARKVAQRKASLRRLERDLERQREEFEYIFVSLNRNISELLSFSHLEVRVGGFFPNCDQILWREALFLLGVPLLNPLDRSIQTKMKA